MSEEQLSAEHKALRINLDPTKYGTFAEIGAGQEVARHFFVAGGAAGTVAKSISAYDMQFSDAIYGKARRYVSRERLVQMMRNVLRSLGEPRPLSLHLGTQWPLSTTKRPTNVMDGWGFVFNFAQAQLRTTSYFMYECSTATIACSRKPSAFSAST
jgi:hypothetical protein